MKTNKPITNSITLSTSKSNIPKVKIPKANIPKLNIGMLPRNKYSKWYINLMTLRKYNKKQKGLTESHHIFPKCLFGENDSLVNLTPREHYIAHLLLYKMYLKNYSTDHKWVTKLKRTIELYSYTKNGTIINNSRKFHKVRLEYYSLLS